MLGDKGYLSAAIQLDIFETFRITLEVPYRLNKKNWRPPTLAYKKFRKRIETLFSQLNDKFVIMRIMSNSCYGFSPELPPKWPHSGCCSMSTTSIIAKLGRSNTH